MKVSIPGAPNITLESLLRRKKSNLARFIEASGVTTYELLVERCNRMGVNPPERRAFENLVPPAHVSSPTEGVIIVEAPTETISEMTGETTSDLPILSDPFPQETKRKKRK